MLAKNVIDVRFDISHCGEVRRIATDVDRAGLLVDLKMPGEQQE